MAINGLSMLSESLPNLVSPKLSNLNQNSSRKIQFFQSNPNTCSFNQIRVEYLRHKVFWVSWRKKKRCCFSQKWWSHNLLFWYGYFSFSILLPFDDVSIFLAYAFHATGFFLNQLKTSGNHRFSDVFRVYRRRLMAWDWLKKVKP